MPQLKLINDSDRQNPRDLTILDAALRQGVVFPHSCKTGRCGACKCKILQGVSRAMRLEVGIGKSEREAGWVLSCVRNMETDVLVEIDEIIETELPEPKTLPCKISSISHLSNDVIEVTLRLPPSAAYSFLPGQYVEIIGAGGLRRSYSMANHDSNQKRIVLHIKRVPDGQMSEYWFEEAKQDDLLRLKGPLGTFFLRDYQNKDLVFLATGTGIAPITSILGQMEKTGAFEKVKSVSVFWGGRRKSDVYFDPESISAAFSFTPVFSREDSHWRGARGYVQDALLKNDFDPSNACVYACGSKTMITDAKSQLIKIGLSESQFYSDAFVSSGDN